MATMEEADTIGHSCTSSDPTAEDSTSDHGDVSSEDKTTDKDSDTCQHPLTKRQLKKLKKQERWLKIKPDKRLIVFFLQIYIYIYIFNYQSFSVDTAMYMESCCSCLHLIQHVDVCQYNCILLYLKRQVLFYLFYSMQLYVRFCKEVFRNE